MIEDRIAELEAALEANKRESLWALSEGIEAISRSYAEANRLMREKLDETREENERLRGWIERADEFDIGGGYRIGKHADNTGWSVWDRNDDLAMLLHAETPDAALQAWQEKQGADHA